MEQNVMEKWRESIISEDMKRYLAQTKLLKDIYPIDLIYSMYMDGEPISELAKKRGQNHVCSQVGLLAEILQWAEDSDLSDAQYFALLRRMMPQVLHDVAFAMYT